MTILFCEHCNKEFELKYKVSKKHIPRFCGRRCKTLAQRGRTPQELYFLAYNAVKSSYRQEGVLLTFQAMCGKVGVSSKTFRKYGIIYSQVLRNANIPIPRSKFQTSITAVISQHFSRKQLLTEHCFPNLINPKTGCSLRVDIYIPDIPLVVECDGPQHSDSQHYFNKLADKSGWTTVMISDAIKKTWLKAHNIPLICIPYCKHITQNYVLSFLPTSLR